MTLSKEHLIKQLQTSEDGHYIDENGKTINFSLLSSLDLSYTDLSGIEIKTPWLQNANFSHSILIGTIFMDESYLQGSNFTKANLTGARLRDAWLQGANFDRSNLTKLDAREAQFDGANFNQTNLLDAQLLKASLAQIDLSTSILDGVTLGDCFLDNNIIDQNGFLRSKDWHELYASDLTVLLPNNSKLFLQSGGEVQSWISTLIDS